MPTNFWLMKTEPDVYSIDDLARDGKTMWDGVRNYQARNFMRDKMQTGDLVFFYHSNAEPSGIAGIAKVAGKSYPDPTAFDKKDVHFDPKSKKENPTWYLVDLAFVKKFKNFLSLEELKKNKSLEGMLLLQKGSRLSVQPVFEKHWNVITEME
jgi:predicted RNA-binding protein with PUA-like domain